MRMNLRQSPFLLDMVEWRTGRHPYSVSVRLRTVVTSSRKIITKHTVILPRGYYPYSNILWRGGGLGGGGGAIVSYSITTHTVIPSPFREIKRLFHL